MRIAIIESGIVVNCVEADQDWINANGGIHSDTANIGDSYSGGVFTPSVAPVITPMPNITGFVNSCKASAGGIVGANALATKYPLFFPAVEALNWIDVTALIVDAHTNMVLSDAAYAAFKQAAANNNIPVKLP